MQAGPGSDSLASAVSKEGADTRSPIKALQMGGFHFMLTHGGHRSSTGNCIYRSAPHSPRKLPSLTLSDPSFRTHQGPITTWAKLMIKRQAKALPLTTLLSSGSHYKQTLKQLDTKAPVIGSVWPMPCAKSFTCKNLRNSQPHIGSVLSLLPYSMNKESEA